jgi:hypothetical protein
MAGEQVAVAKDTVISEMSVATIRKRRLQANSCWRLPGPLRTEPDHDTGQGTMGSNVGVDLTGRQAAKLGLPRLDFRHVESGVSELERC